MLAHDAQLCSRLVYVKEISRREVSAAVSARFASEIVMSELQSSSNGFNDGPAFE
jgi:hypothetical protein